MRSIKRDKWFKFRVLKNLDELAAHIPETHIFTEKRLWLFVRKYKHVIVKPVSGSRGRGVIQVSALGDNRYLLHYDNNKDTLRGKDSAYTYIKRLTGSAKYLVQRKICRPKIDGRSFDMRVITQRDPSSGEWRVTARVAKVAGKGYIVSNITRSKGQLLLPSTALKRSTIQHLPESTLLAEIDRIALQTSKALARYYKGHRIYGMDMGPDRNGHIWIIEANLFPSISHFVKLKDTSMYRRIIAFQRAGKAKQRNSLTKEHSAWSGDNDGIRAARPGFNHGTHAEWPVSRESERALWAGRSDGKRAERTGRNDGPPSASPGNSTPAAWPGPSGGNQAAQPGPREGKRAARPGAREGKRAAQPGARDDKRAAQPGARDDKRAAQPGARDGKRTAGPGAQEGKRAVRPGAREGKRTAGLGHGAGPRAARSDNGTGAGSRNRPTRSQHGMRAARSDGRTGVGSAPIRPSVPSTPAPLGHVLS
ncbi:YheC/YheD family protein [Paenibacillus xerothermodurans]|uniref:ATP-grasp domain-containing protein n=1 Tax=Paenibacillus xerothermodurans TaxID=1977292 RepID=A0A2W1NF37_PAEXE|nr:YheC/YheD family protein [Paenibacillus xerothermodurans]PZE21671.1 hypothetical protein CBW46_004420 [Paenibacillus xerothermodurans]